MLARRPDIRTTERVRSSARRAMRINTHGGTTAHAPILLQDVPTVPMSPVSPPNSSPQAYTKQVASPSPLKGRLAFEVQEDAWLNDAKPASQAQSSMQATRPAKSTETFTREAGQRLWTVAFYLSERIWYEMYSRVENGLDGSVPMRTPTNIQFARKRVLAILRKEMAMARLVHNLAEAEQVLQRVLDEVLGYGPLEPLLKDEHVTEIIAIGPRLVCAERGGKMQETARVFEDEQHMLRIVENILRMAGRGGEPWRPLIDAYLPGGALVNIVLPPTAVKGPVITIRKRPRELLTMADLVAGATMTQEMADLLAACVKARLNVVICGEKCSGRTTLLNALCAYVAHGERVVTIEEVPELQLSQEHVVSLVAQGADATGPERVTMRDLVLHALRMRPQRIVMGECRGDETSEMLQAMYAGYEGCLMATYAHNVRDCLTRLEISGETKFETRASRAHIVQCIDVVVHVARMRDDSYKITNIAEVQGGDAIKFHSIFHYQQSGMAKGTGEVKGAFQASGFSPMFLPQLEAQGIVLPREMFVLHP